MLEHVLTQGTDLPRPSADPLRGHSRDCTRAFIVHNLTISVTTTALESELAHPDERSQWFQARDRWRRRSLTNASELRRKIMRPEWLAEFLRDEMESLLSDNDIKRAFGYFLYRSLGTITFKADGLLHSIDVGSKLKSLGSSNSRNQSIQGDRESQLLEWKKGMITWRRSHGLSTGRSSATGSTRSRRR